MQYEGWRERRRTIAFEEQNGRRISGALKWSDGEMEVYSEIEESWDVIRENAGNEKWGDFR